MTQNATLSAARQVEALNARLLHLFVQRDNLKSEIEKTETEIAAGSGTLEYRVLLDSRVNWPGLAGAGMQQTYINATEY